MGRIVSRPGLPKLSNQQYEILIWLVVGLTQGQIGKTMGISTGTVGQYIQDLYTKLNVRSKEEAVDLWLAADLMW